LRPEGRYREQENTCLKKSFIICTYYRSLVARMREVRNASTILVGKPDGKGDVDGTMILAFFLEE
jgi:hypothetical protein